MSVWLRLAALGLLLLSPLAAEANWLRNRNSSTATTYYYAPPIVLVPVVAPAVPVFVPPPVAYCPPPAPVAGPAPRIFATPTPAPPTGPSGNPPPTNPPPAGAQPPGIGESRSFYDAYGVAVREDSTRTPDRVTIGFWNHSSKDVVLKVDSQARTLARGQNVVLTLPRQFVWQVDERQAQNEVVPAAQAGVDIVIRR